MDNDVYWSETDVDEDYPSLSYSYLSFIVW